MRNYPLLLKNNKTPTPVNWQKTHVNFLSMQAKSLIDYSNYFLADYRVGPSFILIGSMRNPSNPDAPYNCYSIERLKYHQYRDTEDEEAIYFLNQNDYQEGQTYEGDTNYYKKIKNGRHIINNNQKESSNLTYKDWQNIAIQPMGYAAFYLIHFDSGKLLFEYTKNAQLYYGDASPIQILDFYTRYFYLYNGVMDFTIPPLMQEYKTLDILSTINGNPVILDKQGFVWTDRVTNYIQGFNFIKTTENSFGEEFVADTKRELTMRIDKVGVATYTITMDGDLANGDRYWPSNSYIRFL